MTAEGVLEKSNKTPQFKPLYHHWLKTSIPSDDVWVFAFAQGTKDPHLTQEPFS
jgi:hypothetical protein